MTLYISLLCNTTPIRCTPLPLHPPVMNTHILHLQELRLRDTPHLAAQLWGPQRGPWNNNNNNNNNGILQEQVLQEQEQVYHNRKVTDGMGIGIIVIMIIVYYSVVWYSIVQWNLVQHSIVYSIVQYSTVQYSIAQYSIVWYSLLQYGRRNSREAALAKTAKQKRRTRHTEKNQT